MSCTDGLDNDGDGRIDCWDNDCAMDAACMGEGDDTTCSTPGDCCNASDSCVLDATCSGGIRPWQSHFSRRIFVGSIAAAAIEDQIGTAREDQVFAAVAVCVADGDPRGLAHRVLGAVAEQPERR